MRSRSTYLLAADEAPSDLPWLAWSDDAPRPAALLLDDEPGLDPVLDPPSSDDDEVPADDLPPMEPTPVEPPPVHLPEPEAETPAPVKGPRTIDYEQILIDRPDVLKGFYDSHAAADPNSTAWSDRVGAATPEAYAKYWYQAHGKYEGYNQGTRTAEDNVSLDRILTDRPDVLRRYYEDFYGAGNDRHSTAWAKRVGGDTPEAYAKYWYEKYGRWEGYSQTDKAAAEAIDVQRLLVERPDVMRGFYEEFHGPNNDKKSHAWVDRVGGDTVEDYAKYWYVTYGQKQGYTQRPPESSEPDAPPTEPGPPVHDPADDPWNHPAIFPDWTPPYEGWQPPPDIWHGAGDPQLEPEPAPTPEETAETPVVPPPVTIFDPDPLG